MAKSKSIYDIFTKAELVEFLTKHKYGDRYGRTAFEIMIEPKMDNILKQIGAINFKEKALLQSGDREKRFAKMRANNKRWIRLNKKYDKLSELRLEIKFSN